MKNWLIGLAAVGLLVSACIPPAVQVEVPSGEETSLPPQERVDTVRPAVKTKSAKIPAPGNQAVQSIGEIELIHTSIHRNELEVEQVSDLFQEDSLYFHSGGEGFLDLAGLLKLHVFNSSRLGGLTVEDVPGAPLASRLFLERGGFTGELAPGKGSTDIQTPGGAVVHVKGTTFIVVYDPDRHLTTAGNFSGSVSIASGGSRPVEISPGTMRQAADGAPPGPEQPLPFTRAGYEQRARELQSAVEPLYPQGQVLTDTPPPPPESPPVAEVIQNAWCRTGPSQVFEQERSYTPGVVLSLDGRLADSSWWRVAIPDKPASCWISANLLSLSGDLDRVPVLPSPPTPTPTPTEVPPPTQTPTFPPPTEPPVPVDTAGPEFGSVIAAPDPVNGGVNCPVSPYGTQLYVIAFDSQSGVAGVTADWVIASESGSTGLERVDDLTFSGWIGSFNSIGELQIHVIAWDNAGNSSDTWLSVGVEYMCIE